MSSVVNPPSTEPVASDFIRDIVSAHVAEKRYSKICTRFPPEPNGYLHIGHAKSICLNFGIARDFDGICNLRMDDTNPTKEDIEYVESIQEDVRWLIAGWADNKLGLKPTSQSSSLETGRATTSGRAGSELSPGRSGSDSSVLVTQNPSVLSPQSLSLKTDSPFFASDYFPQIYDYAIQLIEKGLAYVCDLTPEETDAYRGAPDRPGKDSPFRNRSVEENLDLFTRMKAGEFPDGKRTLRAKIDMSSPNIWLRDPILYRIRHAEHHHTGNQWCIYPMYDFAHCLSDYIEGITHSICTLEFEVHRPLYDWILEHLDLPRALPRQYEFARLNLSYTVMSKRKLLQLVNEKHVSGWNDPRLPTISGLRRRGVPASALRKFAQEIGVTKYNGLTDVAVLENIIRKDLNSSAQRRLAVLRPIKIILTNYPEGQVEQLDAINNPEDPNAGSRKIPFSRELFIDADDFMETPPKGYFRLQPGGEVRLKYAYIIKCESIVKDAAGAIAELHCTIDLESKSGGATANRKVKGTIHWVSATHAIDAEVRLYDRLFNAEEPDAAGDFRQTLNPDSLKTVTAKCEPGLRDAQPGQSCQFERLGYFFLDSDSSPARPIFNRTITLKDTWSKETAKTKK